MKRRIKCDACSLPLRLGSDSRPFYLTDERICRNTDGPGFFLCDRPACREVCDRAEAAGGLARLRVLYADGRRKNERKRGRPKTGKSKDTVLVAFRLSREMHNRMSAMAKQWGHRGVNALVKVWAEIAASS